MPLEYQRLVNKLVQTLLLPYGNQFKIPTIYERLIQLVDCYGQRPHINPLALNAAKRDWFTRHVTCQNPMNESQKRKRAKRKGKMREIEDEEE